MSSRSTGGLRILLSGNSQRPLTCGARRLKRYNVSRSEDDTSALISTAPPAAARASATSDFCASLTIMPIRLRDGSTLLQPAQLQRERRHRLHAPDLPARLEQLLIVEHLTEHERRAREVRAREVDRLASDRDRDRGPERDERREQVRRVGHVQRDEHRAVARRGKLLDDLRRDLAIAVRAFLEQHDDVARRRRRLRPRRVRRLSAAGAPARAA